MTNPVKNIDEYIATFPKAVQKQLQQIRLTVKKTAPAAAEAIKYKMPTFVLNGNLVFFAAFKNHIGFYGLPSLSGSLKKEIAMYKMGRGSVQFPLGKSMPLNLISELVKLRVKENLEKTKAKKTSTRQNIVYHKDGSIWAKGNMIADKPDGYWEWFRKDGVIMRSGYFKKGNQVGEWTTYDKSGNVYKVTTIK